jgi:hypothetical protein
MTLAVGVHAMFATEIDVDPIVRLLVDPRWPWQPQLLRAGSIPGGARTPQIKGKIPRAALAGALTTALAAPTTGSIYLSCSRLEASNHAWLSLHTGRDRIDKADCPFDLRAYARVPSQGAGEWLELVHELVAAVGSRNGVVDADRDEGRLHVEISLTTASLDGRPVHPDAAGIGHLSAQRFFLGGAKIRPPRWGTYLAPPHVAAAGGRARIAEVVAPAVLRDVGELLYVQLSGEPDSANAPETDAKRRAFAQLLAAITA